MSILSKHPDELFIIRIRSPYNTGELASKSSTRKANLFSNEQTQIKLSSESNISSLKPKKAKKLSKRKSKKSGITKGLKKRSITSFKKSICRKWNRTMAYKNLNIIKLKKRNIQISREMHFTSLLTLKTLEELRIGMNYEPNSAKKFEKGQSYSRTSDASLRREVMEGAVQILKSKQVNSLNYINSHENELLNCEDRSLRDSGIYIGSEFNSLNDCLMNKQFQVRFDGFGGSCKDMFSDNTINEDCSQLDDQHNFNSRSGFAQNLKMLSAIFRRHLTKEKGPKPIFWGSNNHDNWIFTDKHFKEADHFIHTQCSPFKLES